jgi:hypothetical protein
LEIERVHVIFAQQSEERRVELLGLVHLGVTLLEF